jgi:hypothetical protein
MTVRELMAALALQDPDAPVVVGYDGCALDEATRVAAELAAPSDWKPSTRWWEATYGEPDARSVVVIWGGNL